MNLLDESIKCKSCDEIISEPVVLYCGHSICKYHVDIAVKENQKLMKCDICNKSFDIPINGFAPNRALENLMEVDIDELDLGEEYNAAFDKCEYFGDLLDQLNSIKNDPEVKIHTVLSDLRNKVKKIISSSVCEFCHYNNFELNKVDLRREELKQEIDKKALEMIEKLNQYEKDCKASIKPDSSLDNKIDKWKTHLKGILKSGMRFRTKWHLISKIFNRSL